MRSFKDCDGLEWQVNVTIDAVKRVRDVLKFDLLDLDKGKSIESLIDDPIMLCDVLYVVCSEQVAKRGKTDADFGRAMAGDSLDDAVTALLEELVNFFPSRKRHVLAKALAMTRKIEAKMVENANRRLDDPSVMEKIERSLSMSGKLSGAAPESAD